MVNKNNKLCSVIMPAYNSEKYIREAVESVLAQNYDCIELLCVDDSSSDSSFEILQEYASMDSRVKCFQKKNEGAGAARNYALDKAKGEYIAFLDSDDIMRPGALLHLISLLEKHEADVVCGSFYNVDEDGKELFDGKIELPIEEEGEIEEEELWDLYYRGGLAAINDVWTKVYKANVWENIRFPHKRCEDLFVLPKLLSKKPKIVATPFVVTDYRWRNSSITHEGNIKTRIDEIESNINLLEYFIENGQELQKMEQFGTVSRYYIRDCQSGTCKEEIDSLKRLKLRLNKAAKKINGKGVKDRVRLLLFRWCFPLYSVLQRQNGKS